MLRLVLMFSLYQLMGWIFHLLLLSITAFFHFQLGHSLRSVDQWVVVHGWYLVILTKLAAILTFWFFLHHRLSWRGSSLLLNIDWQSIRPRRETIILLTFMSIYAFTISRPVVNETRWEQGAMLLSYIGITTFYLADIFIYDLLLSRLFWDNRGRVHPPSNWVLLLLALLSAGTLQLSYGHLQKLDITLWVNLFFVFYLVGYYHQQDKSGVNWLRIIPFILLIFAPLGALLGEDPLWGDRFSAFTLPAPYVQFQFVIMITLSVLYLLLIKHLRVDRRGEDR
ncbi:MAG: hypothetical protein HN353_00980 [Bdellovibrionales bacterium]|nr:hypothetical protein [Bdellovibrionales bacterium]MBT3526757.1 hypothetical protein [Bdellovibrionales bacterium]MBT7767738.1 hypothetical protein [Bdellovibrionales bacterium]